ncbi:hydrolase 1, exosortase A system-associated [Alishewanella tabrizica]|uniref:Hydrolase 1, exosortase A system-associated n=1 Tax=Alishewanella tabrizica TaxID=671278 RepID=A0ABQ2WLK2_9ALTE|nr:hydrolase 1, exosortase A system-associated [Alishewanella tabrizica]GGW62728.1 hydrolase 1, exosortase A system-associated [Alishewanella tabrizica]
MTERYISIANGDGTLSAILHSPDDVAPLTNADTGVLIIVGGPQYRVGSHRQFVKLSRALASQGIASMRLDTAGMGDSNGIKTAFYQQDEDINQAIAAFFQHCPQLKKVALWGLCDAASGILIKLNQHDPRISGVILLNPWVRQQHSHANVMLRHYYPKRLLSFQFWRKKLAGGMMLRLSLSELWQTFKHRYAKQYPDTETLIANEQNYVKLMLRGWQQFQGNVLVITSGNDLTAQEFLQLCNSDKAWAACLADAQHQHIAAANHTFASAKWRQQVEQCCIAFIKQP